jgi:hypothetical protein
MTFHSLQMVANAAGSLSSRAMLRGVRLSIWEGFRYDAEATQQINEDNDAEHDGSRLNKRLLPKHALKDVKAAANAIRIYHGRVTLPWSDNGLDILPAAMVTAYDAKMRELRLQFEAAVDAFILAYPSYLATAPQRLGKLFKVEDYPTQGELHDKFAFRVRTMPLPDARDFRVDMSDAQVRIIQAEIEEASREALEAAMRNAFERVSDVCSRMVEKLNAYKPAASKSDKVEGIFRDSLIDNVRDLVALLPAFNLSNDPLLADITIRMTDKLCAHSADELRDDSDLRRDVAEEAAAILSDVSAFLA